MSSVYLLAFSLFFSPHRSTGYEFDFLSTVTDEQLLACYAWAAQASPETADVVEGASFSQYGIGCARPGPSHFIHRYYQQTCSSILERRKTMAPVLIRFIENEWSTPPEKGKKNLLPDLLSMLHVMYDLQAVPLLLKILEQPSRVPGGRDHELCQRILAKLTHLCFNELYSQPFMSNIETNDCVPHPQLQSSDPKTIARYYREWMATEGMDSAQWLNSVRSYARGNLQGTDLTRQYHSAIFLSHPDRDDQPAETLKWLAAKVDTYRKNPTRESRTQVSWLLIMTKYGTQAEPYIDRFIKEYYLNDGRSGSLGFMEIGGNVAMEFVLQEIANPMFPQNEANKGRYVNEMSKLERAFDRWAGIPFDSVKQRIDWWNKNKRIDVETRLRQHLPALAEMADQPDKMVATSLLHLIVPESVSARQGSAFKYSNWIKERQSKLQYQPRYGTFRLAP